MSQLPAPVSRQAVASHILGLDSIRGLSAVWVVLYHFGGFWLNSTDTYQEHSLRKLWFLILNFSFNGPAAVMVFFIISGIVVHYPNSKRPFQLGQFWIRRFVRIGGPLLVALALSHVLKTLNQPPNLPTWSLYCELIYYAFYPVLVILKRRVGWGLILLVAIAAAAILSFLPERHGGQFWTYGYSLTWILGYPLWIGGAWLSEHLDRVPNLTPLRIYLFRLLMWLLSCIALPLGYHGIVPFKQSLLLFGLPAALWLACEIRFASSRPSNSHLEWLGAISYSLYLCHELVPPLFKIFGVRTTGFFVFLAMLSAVMALTLAFYYLIELQFHRLARNWSRRAPVLAIIGSEFSRNNQFAPLNR